MCSSRQKSPGFSPCRVIIAMRLRKGCACFLLRWPLPPSHPGLSRIQRNPPILCLCPFTFLNHTSRNCSLHYQRDSPITRPGRRSSPPSTSPSQLLSAGSDLHYMSCFDIASFGSFFSPRGKLSVDVSIVSSAARWSRDGATVTPMVSDLQKEVSAHSHGA